MKTIAVKFSGEYSADEIASSVLSLPSQVNIVIICGGGNLFRGRDAKINRPYEDRIGMCSTLINSIRLKCLLGDNSEIFATNIMGDICKSYALDKVKRCLNEKRIPIIAGGLGCGYLSTDTAMVIRALELNCECAIKITKVGAVYDKNPKLFEDAKRLYNLSYEEAQTKNAFDKVSIILAQENQLPFLVMGIDELEKYLRIGEANCTIIK